MQRRIFVNLAVRDRSRSQASLGALGVAFDPRLTGDKAACRIVHDAAYMGAPPAA